MTAPMLSVRNLSKIFGGLVAVDEVSLDVRPRRGGRPAWRQRRRQVDADQMRLRRLSGGRGRDRLRRQTGSVRKPYGRAPGRDRDDLSGSRARQQSRRRRQHLSRPRGQETPLRRARPDAGRPADAEGIAADARFAPDPLPDADRSDRELVRRPAPGGRDRPRSLLGRQAHDHGRAHQQSRRARNSTRFSNSFAPSRIAASRLSSSPTFCPTPSPSPTASSSCTEAARWRRRSPRGPTRRNWCSIWSGRARTPRRRPEEEDWARHGRPRARGGGRQGRRAPVELPVRAVSSAGFDALAHDDYRQATDHSRHRPPFAALKGAKSRKVAT